MILVFDLDDTLFDAGSFYASGNRAVAEFIASSWGLEADRVLKKIIEIARRNNGHKIFDDTLEFYGIYSKKAVGQCLMVFRRHNNPKIELFPDAERALKRFKNWPKYIVTDGNKIVQHSKIVALGLEDLVKKVFISHRYGLHNAKPSPYIFNKITKLENTQPGDVIYIGDNPNKDFVGIKPLGFKTIRVVRGVHKDTKLAQSHEAHNRIDSLDELTEEFLLNLENK